MYIYIIWTFAQLFVIITDSLNLAAASPKHRKLVKAPLKKGVLKFCVSKRRGNITSSIFQLCIFCLFEIRKYCIRIFSGDSKQKKKKSIDRSARRSRFSLWALSLSLWLLYPTASHSGGTKINPLSLLPFVNFSKIPSYLPYKICVTVVTFFFFVNFFAKATTKNNQNPQSERRSGIILYYYFLLLF